MNRGSTHTPPPRDPCLAGLRVGHVTAQAGGPRATASARRLAGATASCKDYLPVRQSTRPADRAVALYAWGEAPKRGIV